MALPANWDSSTISVDTNTMSSVAQAVITSATNINGYLNNIMDALNGIKPSWTGDSSSVADDFNTRWSNALTALFGTKSDPSTGILNILMKGLDQAAQNYIVTEGAIADMFTTFGKGDSGSGSGGQKDIKDDPYEKYYHTTSVNETF
jgi:uncharacterized protein YukE